MVADRRKAAPVGQAIQIEATSTAEANSFDPWTATLHEAVAAANATHEPSCLFRWQVAQELKEAEAQAEKSTQGEILDSVAKCAQFKLAMPDWLARAFLARHRLVREFRVRSWDEAFGKPFAKRTRPDTERQHTAQMQRLRDMVFWFLLKHPRGAIGPMWVEWGNALGVSDKQAEKLYKQAVEKGIAKPLREIRDAARKAAASLQKPR